MKGDLKLWGILNDKLDMLRASNRIPEAIRIAETVLTLAQRGFKPGDPNYTLSLERLGQLHDQAGDRAAAKPYLVKAHAFLEKADPPDDRAVFRSSRRLGFVCDNLGETEAALSYYEAAFKTGARLPDIPYSDLGTILNNVALIYRKSGRQKAAEPTTCRHSRFTKGSLDRSTPMSLPSSTTLPFFTPTSGGLPKRKKPTCARSPFAKNFIHRPIRTLPNRSATSRSFITRTAITPGRPNSTGPRSRRGRRRRKSRRKITRSWLRITRICCAR
jgi:hypothetical protein